MFAFQGETIYVECGASCFKIEEPCQQRFPEASEIFISLRLALKSKNANASERIEKACKNTCISMNEIVFLDIETTSTNAIMPLFLIGLMHCSNDCLKFKLFFARNLGEELGAIIAASQELEKHRLLITFNGKHFDMPYLQKRAQRYRISLSIPPFHLDLLHEAQTKFKGITPNCRLQTLETYVCGRTRDNDIPSAMIPIAYKIYLKQQDDAMMSGIIKHNMTDLLSMADLIGKMWNLA